VAWKESLSSTEIESDTLEKLLKDRENGKVDFLLIDIRELYEYSDLSIEGTDLLLPTTTIHTKMELLESLKDRFLILYCRTGSRTSHMLRVLSRMNFKRVTHLSNGIVSYGGRTLKNAPIPNKIDGDM